MRNGTWLHKPRGLRQIPSKQTTLWWLSQIQPHLPSNAMNISVDVQPFNEGYQYTYILPLHGDAGLNLSAIFGSNFQAPNLFQAVGVDEYIYFGKILYSPSNLQAFRFYSDFAPMQGSIILRSGGVDTWVDAAYPVPEPGHMLLLGALVIWLARGRQRSRDENHRFSTMRPHTT